MVVCVVSVHCITLRSICFLGVIVLFFTRGGQGLLEGMNQFLRQMEITFRRDPENFRPRINKMDRCVCLPLAFCFPPVF